MISPRQMSHKIAQLPLDFTAEQSMCGVRTGETHGRPNRPDRHQGLLKEIHTRLNEAAGIAKAADACAEAGDADRGVKVPPTRSHVTLGRSSANSSDG